MELYHVLNRGVDKRKIFLDEQDYFRFVHDLFEFNDKQGVETTFYKFNKQYNDVRRRYIGIGQGSNKKPRKLLVNIHAFSLMPNHYHLLLSPIAEKGIPLFIKKLNGGYAKYFNEKYKRKGTLFEGKYKRVLIKTESHFIHIPYYIHLNPLDLHAPEWRKRKLNDYRKAIEFLKKYRWSSHIDYTGVKNFPSVTQREFLLETFRDNGGYNSFIKSWLKSFDEENLENLLLE